MEQENKTKKSAALTLIEILIVIAVIAIILFVLLPIIRPPHPPAYGIHCMSNLKTFALSLCLYYQDNASTNIPAGLSLPTPDKWNDLISPYLPDEKSYLCPMEKRSPKTSTYVLNKYIYDLKEPIPNSDNMVLAFEGPIGWNQTGGPEDMVFRHGPEKDPYCCITFTDGSVARVNKSETKNLKWKPEQKTE